jgi:anti-sigma factor RsiW
MTNADLPHPDETRLNDYVDGLLEADAAAGVDAHLAACAACRTEVERLRGLLALARALPDRVEPPADVWAGIAARTVGLGRARRDALRSLRLPLAAAAAALVALGATATAFVLTRAGPAAVGDGDITLADVRDAAQTRAVVVAVEAEYDRAFDALWAELETRRDRLDPETVAVVEENLRIVNEALRAARAALDADPANRDLPLLITATHRQRLELVERALYLIDI